MAKCLLPPNSYNCALSSTAFWEWGFTGGDVSRLCIEKSTLLPSVSYFLKVLIQGHREDSWGEKENVTVFRSHPDMCQMATEMLFLIITGPFYFWKVGCGLHLPFPHHLGAFTSSLLPSTGASVVEKASFTSAPFPQLPLLARFLCWGWLSHCSKLHRSDLVPAFKCFCALPTLTCPLPHGSALPKTLILLCSKITDSNPIYFFFFCFNNRNLLSQSFGGQKSKIKGSVGLVPSEGREGESVPCFLPSFWWSAGNPWLENVWSHLCLHLHTAFSLYACLCPDFSPL